MAHPSWVFCGAQPVAAERYYTFGKVTFHPDSSFQAEARIEGRPIRAVGTYEYKPCQEQLTLWTAGKELTYEARVQCGKKLRFKKELPDGTELAVTMLRQHPCPDCATCGPCDMMYRKYRPRPDEDLAPAQAEATDAPSTSLSVCACRSRRPRAGRDEETVTRAP